MYKKILFICIVLSCFIFFSYNFGSDKQFKLSQVPTDVLNKVYKHLQVLKNEEYETLSISSRGLSGKPSFWIQLNRSAAYHGCLIDQNHHWGLLKDMQNLYNISDH